MGDYGDLLSGFIKGVIVTGVIATAAVGAGIYIFTKHNANKKEVMNKMEWLADHNAVYGNKNGQFDLEEKLGVMKDLKTTFGPDQSISIDDATKYIELYKDGSVSMKK